MKYELRCRSCDETVVFDSVQDAKDSDWFEISPLGAIGGGVSTHRAYCPEYPFES